MNWKNRLFEKTSKAFMFPKIALAVAFSPRMEALIAETRRLVQLFHSELILIHIGEKTGELEQEFRQILLRNGLDEARTTIIWKQGKARINNMKVAVEKGEVVQHIWPKFLNCLPSLVHYLKLNEKNQTR